MPVALLTAGAGCPRTRSTAGAIDADETTRTTTTRGEVEPDRKEGLNLDLNFTFVLIADMVFRCL